MGKKTNFNAEINSYSEMFKNSIGIHHFVMFSKNDITDIAKCRNDLFTKDRALACVKSCGDLYACLCHAIPKASKCADEVGYDMIILREIRP